jgi:hypothetical protein
MFFNPFRTQSRLHAGRRPMKEANEKVVTSFIAHAENKQKQAKASVQFSEDIHVGLYT